MRVPLVFIQKVITSLAQGQLGFFCYPVFLSCIVPTKSVLHVEFTFVKGIKSVVLFAYVLCVICVGRCAYMHR